MTIAAHSSCNISGENHVSGVLWGPLTCLWILILLTFSLPGRVGPDSVGALDTLALLKAGSRAGVVLWMSVLIFSHREFKQRRFAVWVFVPFLIFAAWAICSVVWSPLKSISLGQSASLLAQIVLAISFAVFCRSEQDVERVLKHLMFAMITLAAVLTALNRLDSIGLDRESVDVDPERLVHPTSAGATSSLGIVVLLSIYLLWNWKWVRLLLIPGLMVHGVLLVAAASRTAILLTFLMAGSTTLLWLRRERLIWLLLLISVGFVAQMVIDPNLSLFERGISGSLEYVQRGASVEQLARFSGRAELWIGVWEQFKNAPLFGYGYFVAAENGLLDVWSGPKNRTAHNILLQVMVSTGAIGTVLFLWALGRPARQFARSWRKDPNQARYGRLAITLGIWYFIWGLFCSSFMGPIQPESVLFFTCLGLLAAVTHFSNEKDHTKVSESGEERTDVQGGGN